MKVNQLKTGVVLSYVTQAIHILSGLIYTPIMLRLLGQSEYGLYQLVASVVSYLSLLSLGFGAGYMRFYSRYKVVNDTKGIARVNGMFLIIFSVIAGICLLCGAVMIANIRWVFGSGLLPEEMDKARILLAMMVFNMAVSFINSVFTSNITANEKFILQRMIELLRVLFNPFLTLPLLIMGFGSVGVVATATFFTIAAFMANVAYCIKKLHIRFSFGDFDFSLLKEMWAFTFFIFINMIVDQINWSVDKFLLGRMIGTTAVAVYGVAGQLNSMYQSMASAVSGVFVPRVNILVAQGNSDRTITELFAKVGRIQFMILALALSGFIIFGRSFIGLWAGEGYGGSYQIGLLLMIPVTVPLIQNLGIEIQRARNMHKARSIVYLFVAISNIFVSIPCIKRWGASGAAIGTAISLCVGNCLFMNWYYYFRLGINIAFFWKEILRIVPPIAAAMIFGTLLNKFLPMQRIIFLLPSMAAYAVVYCAMVWRFGMNDYERGTIGAPIKKILKIKE